MQTAVKEQWHSLSLPPRVAAPKPPPLHEEAETGVEVGVQQAGWREAFHKRLTKQILLRQTRYDRSTIQHLLQGRSNVFFRVFCHVLWFAFLTQGIIKAKNCKLLWKRWCLCTARVHRATNRQHWQTGVSHVQITSKFQPLWWDHLNSFLQEIRWTWLLLSAWRTAPGTRRSSWWTMLLIFAKSLPGCMCSLKVFLKYWKNGWSQILFLL